MTGMWEGGWWWRRLGFAVVLGAAGLGPAGCMATQSWVQDQIRQANEPIQARVAQLEKGAAEAKTGLDQVNGRIGQLDKKVTDADFRATQVDAHTALVESRVTEVDGRVGQAVAQATEARKIADEKTAALDQRLTRALDNRFKRDLVETVNLRFAPGQSRLLPTHEEVLRRVLQKLAENPTYTADIVGYTDGMGPQGYNLNLSWQREEAVRRYLVEHGTVLDRLAFIGLGEDLTGGDKNHPLARAADRQVAIMLYRPAP